MSILSDSVAQRCNLMRLVDKRFQTTVHGVGGAQQLVGKIHACKNFFVNQLNIGKDNVELVTFIFCTSFLRFSGQVQIEEQFFPCNFDVLADRDIDVLLGLDILKRHCCVINLQNNCLR